MYLAANVLVFAVLDDLMRHRPLEIAIAGVFIGRDQFHFVADGIAHELSQRFGVRLRGNVKSARVQPYSDT